MLTRITHRTLLLLIAGGMLFAQKKTDFTGSWEFIGGEENGQWFPPHPGFKETQVWQLNDLTLSIKMMVFYHGYFSLDLNYQIGAKNGPVGFKTSTNGKKEPVIGRAYWVGDRLVYEQEHPNAEKGRPSRIVRSVHLEKDGAEMVADQSESNAGSDKKIEQKVRWVKKTNLP